MAAGGELSETQYENSREYVLNFTQLRCRRTMRRRMGSGQICWRHCLRRFPSCRGRWQRSTRMIRCACVRACVRASFVFIGCRVRHFYTHERARARTLTHTSNLPHHPHYTTPHRPHRTHHTPDLATRRAEGRQQDQLRAGGPDKQRGAGAK